jgi:hypothetical protein
MLRMTTTSRKTAAARAIPKSLEDAFVAGCEGGEDGDHDRGGGGDDAAGAGAHPARTSRQREGVRRGPNAKLVCVAVG